MKRKQLSAQRLQLAHAARQSFILLFFFRSSSLIFFSSTGCCVSSGIAATSPSYGDQVLLPRQKLVSLPTRILTKKKKTICPTLLKGTAISIASPASIWIV